MKNMIFVTLLSSFAVTAFALPSSGEFIAKQCGYSPYQSGKVSVCVGYVAGSPTSDFTMLATHLQIGDSVFALDALTQTQEIGEASKSYPGISDVKEYKMKMLSLSKGETVPQSNASSIEVKIATRDLDVSVVETTLPNGETIIADEFTTTGGAN